MHYFPHEIPTQEDTSWSPVPQVIPEGQFISCVLAVGAVVLMEGCAVYPAYPAYPAYGQVAAQPGTVTVAPAPVYAAPAPVYYGGPLFYPSISIFGRFGGGHYRYR